jgi:hypothetical protein
MRRNRATAERAAPRLGILVSILLHAGLVLALFVSFSKKLEMPTDMVSMVPVDLVTVADQNNVAPTVKKEDLTPPDVKEQEPEPTPDVAPPKLDIAPDVQPKPKPEKKTDTEKFDINDIQKLLAKKKPANAKVAQRTVQGMGAGTAMTVDLITLLQSEINRCWTRPDYGPHPERLIVRYELFLNRDGSVAQAPKLMPESAGAASSDPYMRAAADAGRRAIYQCAPYRLPADRYNLWRDIVFTFDPRSPVE